MTENPTLPGAPAEAPGREFHTVAHLFPMLRGAAFEELVADIKKNGLREPILCDAQGRIVDGRNRYRACLAAGVEPRFVEWQGEGSLPELALSLNLHRRHLDESQRAMVAARLAKLLETETRPKGRPRKNSANLQNFSVGYPHAEAAASVSVSLRLVSSATKLLRDGCEELIGVVESGEVGVSPAGVLAGLPGEEQKKVVGRLPWRHPPVVRVATQQLSVAARRAEAVRVVRLPSPATDATISPFLTISSFSMGRKNWAEAVTVEVA